VIQRRQVLLVQVVKEERGNKGAALTTYLSLAGRYCVLMPNTSHGGGISRKISNGSDRKRLKSIIADLSLPGTMGLIVRTAGLERTKTEIKRDFDYLARLWDEVREKTLRSSAPALIYRDSDLVKRAIRDLYHRDIDQVLVEGEEGYKAARGFMKLLMPSHVKKVQSHNEATPLFQRYGVEDQLAAMYHPLVQLKSGGYIVINPTEALVSIDINSGRSTREHNIEQTAYATNIEAAQEIARQLRLRDMAGLIVIDFIDMEQNSHVRKVEKAMKEALKYDRARIQVGRISGFGLMEMSRQRLRTGVLEASTKACPHCEGTGLMRTASSAGLSALRMIEDEAARGRGDKVCLRAGSEAAVYVLNKKRAELADIEARYGVSVEVLVDPTFEGARMAVESSGPRPIVPVRATPAPQPIEDDEPEVDEEEIAEEFADEEENGEREERGEGEGEDRNGRRRRRRRRGGRNRRREGEPGENFDEAAGSEGETTGDEQPVEADDENDAPLSEEEAASEDERRKRRGRRGGRRRGGRGRAGEEGGREEAAEELAPEPGEAPMIEPVPSEDPAPVTVKAAPIAEPEAEEKPKARRRPRARKAEPIAAEAAEAAPAIEAIAPEAPADVAAEDAAAAEEKPKPKRRSRAKKAEAAPEPVVQPEPELELVGAEPAAAEAAAADEATTDDSPAQPARKGWWSRTFG
jgi:ribonuclease E